MTATLSETLNAADLSPAQRRGLIARFQALADDEIVLAQRDGEWTGHAPILEEDIALANIAQDELGHASLYLELRRELDGSDPDRLAFFRDAGEYRCARLVELPRGDWALTMLRQFLYDAAEALWLDAAQASRYAPLAGVAAKALREEKFHLQHSALWAERLGRGTPESARRAQTALDTLWPHAAQLFALLPDEADLVAAGLLPDPDAVRDRWEALVGGHLRDRCDLDVPPLPGAGEGREVHTAHLAPLLTEMQAVARAHPGAGTW
ncbi:1,2-phenylacetyl-CoA epoxidase subunit PaaC [Deinococcus gobiensis]|uniref:Phenylacetate-CoA oxygenase, PaaC subunit n=1 Tax=Deinococcus gobiensis (strain DSM 21396 / JCM 16679 / CGMCC 1.7299 / I-0) TaxID=745776 RepID=H8GVV3_DEIGI|nr:1,2-phenylacetyl-CoA epoxidase subunit PaaC [Deinococcus gobiensis]AFD26818.1 Phenylacetate-CoA oxygenase, PaaC subunit [Deinococcus gobiensis I-0]